MRADELAAVWPERWPRGADSTNENNRAMVKAFGEDFAGRELHGITREEARHWALANVGAARYVRAMFNDAVDDGLLRDNPFAGLRLPDRGETVIDPPSEKELAVLVVTARTAGRESLACAIDFAAFTGLRVGEQCAVVRGGERSLRGNVVSGDRGNVEWQRTRSGSLRRPKTRQSIRSFVVFEAARDALVAAHEHSGAGPFLFPSRYALEHEWRWLRRETGLHFRWHALRHFHATWLLDRGAKVEDVAVQLGCSRQMVEDHYGHPDRGLALERLEEVTADVS